MMNGLFIRKSNRVYGPFDQEQMTNCLERGLFSMTDEGSLDRVSWMPLKDILEENRPKSGGTPLRPVAAPGADTPVGLADDSGTPQPLKMAPPPVAPTSAMAPSAQGGASPNAMNASPAGGFSYDDIGHVRRRPGFWKLLQKAFCALLFIAVAIIAISYIPAVNENVKVLKDLNSIIGKMISGDDSENSESLEDAQDVHKKVKAGSVDGRSSAKPSEAVAEELAAETEESGEDVAADDASDETDPKTASEIRSCMEKWLEAVRQGDSKSRFFWSDPLQEEKPHALSRWMIGSIRASGRNAMVSFRLELSTEGGIPLTRTWKAYLVLEAEKQWKITSISGEA